MQPSPVTGTGRKRKHTAPDLKGLKDTDEGGTDGDTRSQLRELAGGGGLLLPVF